MKITDIINGMENVQLPNKHELILEKHGRSIVDSTANFFEYAEKNLTEDECRKLEGKLILAIKSRDPAKFSRLLQRVLEDRHDK